MVFKLRDAAGMRINGKEVHEAMLNNQLVWYNDKYCVEYSISPREDVIDTVDEMYNSSYAYYLPRIYSTKDKFSFNYDKILIFKKNGEVTTDVTINVEDVSKIRLWYPSNTHHISFYGAKSTATHRVKHVYKIDTRNFSSLEHLFTYCSQLSYFGCELDTNNVTSTNYMFSNCNVTTANVNFSEGTKLSGMANMFYNCGFLTRVSFGDYDLDMSSLVNISGMFNSCRDITSVNFSNWKNVNKLQYIQRMFYNCERLTEVKGMDSWRVQIANAQEMFYGCSRLERLIVPNLVESVYELEGALSFYDMFAYCSSLKELDLSNWNLDNGITAIDALQMFDYCNSLSVLNLSNWNTTRFSYTLTNMFRGVPSSVDFCYDGSNYANWTITESRAYFSGTFPWNQ